MEKRLTKSKNKMLAGVCGGVAEYFGFDPTLVRLAFAACCLFWGTGIIFYIAGAIIIPDADGDDKDIIVDSEPDDSDYE